MQTRSSHLLIPDLASVAEDVQRALAEDIGSGDLTAALIPESQYAGAMIICREHAVLCGRSWADSCFKQLDASIELSWNAEDGDALHPDMVVCEIEGPARGIITAERTALNFLQTLSGTATAARRYADAVAGSAVVLLDTRKTLPGLRAAQKYAVRCGGCSNHRQGLYDAMLIKENHIASAGSPVAAITAARKLHPDKSLEIEVETLNQLQQILLLWPDRILLDNFNEADLRTAVQMTAGNIPLEASGNITLDNIRSVVATGVDFISLGSLTKHMQAIDFSLLFIASYD
jgi:nicotinate-nucleotide pyrophosphorylase (carboxylating)